ncbi:hypothetical protein BSLG_005693 [Batrachochytrium salamandrivorans]|nr:hypothetical protein BSLG_005693 [Batrachochytrium salamandrivorans]
MPSRQNMSIRNSSIYFTKIQDSHSCRINFTSLSLNPSKLMPDVVWLEYTLPHSMPVNGAAKSTLSSSLNKISSQPNSTSQRIGDLAIAIDFYTSPIVDTNDTRLSHHIPNSDLLPPNMNSSSNVPRSSQPNLSNQKSKSPLVAPDKHVSSYAYLNSINSESVDSKMPVLIPDTEYAIRDPFSGTSKGWITGFLAAGTWSQIENVRYTQFGVSTELTNLILDNPDFSITDAIYDPSTIRTPLIVQSFAPVFSHQVELTIRGLDTDLISWIRNNGTASGKIWHCVSGDMSDLDISTSILLGEFTVPLEALLLRPSGVHDEWMPAYPAYKQSTSSSDFGLDRLTSDCKKIVAAVQVSSAIPKRNGIGRVYEFVTNSRFFSKSLGSEPFLSATLTPKPRSKGIDGSWKLDYHKSIVLKLSREMYLHFRDNLWEVQVVTVDDHGHESQIGSAWIALRLHHPLKDYWPPAPPPTDAHEYAINREFKPSSKSLPIASIDQSSSVLEKLPTLNLVVSVERATHLPLMNDPFADSMVSPLSKYRKLKLFHQTPSIAVSRTERALSNLKLDGNIDFYVYHIPNFNVARDECPLQAKELSLPVESLQSQPINSKILSKVQNRQRRSHHTQLIPSAAIAIAPPHSLCKTDVLRSTGPADANEFLAAAVLQLQQRSVILSNPFKMSIHGYGRPSTAKKTLTETMQELDRLRESMSARMVKLAEPQSEVHTSHAPLNSSLIQNSATAAINSLAVSPALESKSICDEIPQTRFQNTENHLIHELDSVDKLPTEKAVDSEMATHHLEDTIRPDAVEKDDHEDNIGEIVGRKLHV